MTGSCELVQVLSNLYTHKCSDTPETQHCGATPYRYVDVVFPLLVTMLPVAACTDETVRPS